MDAGKSNIYSILNGSKQFIIPVYQRHYSWEIKQCKQLWNDIVNMHRKNKTGHFVGSIVDIAEVAMPVGVQKYMLIDGQQRMTTLSLLLIALRDYAIDHPEDCSVNHNKIEKLHLINEFEDADEQYKLLLTENDKIDFINLIMRKPGATNSTVSRIVINYKYFLENIKNKELSPSEIYESIGKLQIVNITLDRDKDDAQAIFESLNSTGKELSASDLIRNYVLMGLEPQDQTFIYSHLWQPMEQLFEYKNMTTVMDNFFRDYLTMKLARIPNKSHIYEEFKAYHLNCEFGSIKELCQDLLNNAKFYTDIVFARSSNTQIKALYKDINDLRMEVAFPFLLKVHNDFSENIITVNMLIEIIQMCISYVFRRSICNIPTNSLNKTFATLKNEIRQDDYLNSIKAFFVLRDDYKEFPKDDEFTSAFISRDIYNMHSRNFILSHLENIDNKAPIIIENFTIEHIMPQNKNLNDSWKNMLGSNWSEIQKTYLHTIGNLTLTAYNSEMSDKSFDEKLNMDGGFKVSALHLNSYVVKKTCWNESTIRERANELVEIAKKIWAYPSISDADLTKYIQPVKHNSNTSVDSYEMNMVTKTLFEMLDKRILNLSSDIKREFKKKYIAYKLDTNVVDIVVQKQRLRLSVNMKYSDLYDPNGICRDITGLGRWGNGDVEVFFEHTSDIDDIMDIIIQSYKMQTE